ncbi:hypothetical protein [Denitromonas halophila]|uniref:hypothetical protein n=1 Tax=Denitromonas halophila TaxID=1629404 RepID=UPI00164238E8|nr:hypothetical protein [Denitromonas halophila]
MPLASSSSWLSIGLSSSRGDRLSGGRLSGVTGAPAKGSVGVVASGDASMLEPVRA